MFVEYLFYIRYWDIGLSGGNNIINRIDKVFVILNFIVEVRGGNN